MKSMSLSLCRNTFFFLLLSLANTNKQKRNARRQAKALTQKELLKTETEINRVSFLSLSLEALFLLLNLATQINKLECKKTITNL
jgi:hypothetical protein